MSNLPTGNVPDGFMINPGEMIVVSGAEASNSPAETSSDSPILGSVNRVNPESSLQLAKTAARVIGENMGTKIIVLDMTKLTALFDYHVIATGTSSRQLRAMADEIERVLKLEFKEKMLRADGMDEGRWIVQDFGTIIVHLFDEDTRAFYSLENLWADASKVDLSGLVPQGAAG